MPLELMELRCGSSSTAFCTQYGSKDRHARLGGGVHAETIMGRLVHGTVWLKMGASTFASPPSSRYGNAQILSRHARGAWIYSSVLFIQSPSSPRKKRLPVLTSI